MGRKRQTNQTVQQLPASDQPRGDRLTNWALSLPRVARIVLVTLPALATAIICTPVAFGIYDRLTISTDAAFIPTLIVALATFTMYIVGWILVVGTAGDQPEDYRAAMWYLSASIIVILVAVLWLVSMIFTTVRIQA